MTEENQILESDMRTPQSPIRYSAQTDNKIIEGFKVLLEEIRELNKILGSRKGHEPSFK